MSTWTVSVPASPDSNSQPAAKMSAKPPPVVPRKPSGVRVMVPPGGQLPLSVLPVYRDAVKESRDPAEPDLTSLLHAEREVEILNHCFDDVERFMARLQQTAEAQIVLNQRRKKSSRKSKKKEGQADDLLTLKACPPPEEEFVDIFQKIKYSLSLLDRLKSSITQPDAPEILHHVFVPLRLMVNTTGGPALAASVLSPAMTSGAVSTLQEHLTADEKELWTSLGLSWTSSCSHLGVSVPPYAPAFLDGWRPHAHDSTGQPLEDPVESQHKQDAHSERRRAAQTVQEQAEANVESRGQSSDDGEDAMTPHEGETLYCCSYDFVARNSSELSVLQGETLEVIESSKRWWKCQNRFDQIGFVPFNILEPLSALNHTEQQVVRRESKKRPLSHPTKYFSYAPPSPDGNGPMSPLRPQSMLLPSTTLQGDDGDRVNVVNDELLQRLAGRRDSTRPPVSPRSTADPATPLNYHSPAAEVQAWLHAKGFSQQTVQGLGILTGAQLYSLNKEELRTVAPEEGARVYSQIMVQKALLEDVRKATELETVMEKQKMKIGMKS